MNNLHVINGNKATKTLDIKNAIRVRCEENVYEDKYSQKYVELRLGVLSQDEIFYLLTESFEKSEDFILLSKRVYKQWIDTKKLLSLNTLSNQALNEHITNILQNEDKKSYFKIVR